MCFCERQTITGSSGQGGQVTIHGHATGRDQRYEMRAAQEGSGDGGCSGSGYRCGLMTASDRKKQQTGQLTFGKASTTSAMLVMRAVENRTLGPSARPKRTTTPCLSPFVEHE